MVGAYVIVILAVLCILYYPQLKLFLSVPKSVANLAIDPDVNTKNEGTETLQSADSLFAETRRAGEEVSPFVV